MELGLRGKVALVTGGSRGIGRGIAIELAKAGCTLVLSARDEAALRSVAGEVEVLGSRAHVVVADLLAEDAPERLAQAVGRETGCLDILVNNAGAVRRGDFFALTRKEWHDGFGVKFFAHVWLSRALWPLLKAGGGSVVFIAGIGARAPVADYMVGAAAIGASIAFMKSLAELGKRDGVQVLAINPGSVDTDRFRRRLALIMRTTGLDEAAATAHHRRELDITRFGTPEDIGNIVAFAVSQRGRWLHGTAIDIDGGQVDPLRMFRYDAPEPRTSG
ncbi:MAG: SDR family NAD(P)-dependent oxidoreductase [Xanthobacteraceae bacterium]